MKTVSLALLLCAALVSSLAQAADLDVRLHLKDPAWADLGVPGTQLAEAPHGNLPAQVVLGAAGGLLLIPGGIAGFLIGDQIAPAEKSCDRWGCDTLSPMGGYLGALTGGYVGLSVGVGLGVAMAGQMLGGSQNLLPAIGGAALGALLSVPVVIAISYLSYYAILAAPVLFAAGAVGGSIICYELSHPYALPADPGISVTPVVTLTPGGGGAAGIAGTF